MTYPLRKVYEIGPFTDGVQVWLWSNGSDPGHLYTGDIDATQILVEVKFTCATEVNNSVSGGFEVDFGAIGQTDVSFLYENEELQLGRKLMIQTYASLGGDAISGFSAGEHTLQISAVQDDPVQISLDGVVVLEAEANPVSFPANFWYGYFKASIGDGAVISSVDGVSFWTNSAFTDPPPDPPPGGSFWTDLINCHETT